jgi:hypothetical protein
MDPSSIIGIILAIVGIAFAFETPRQWIISLFKKTSPVTQKFKIHSVFHFHNEGKPLGPVGTNKTEKTYILKWSFTNTTKNTIHIERCIVMRQRSSASVVSLTVPEFTEESVVYPNQKLELVSVTLSSTKIDHYRHWIKESSAFGFRETSGTVHWINDVQFQQFKKDLQVIAKEYELEEEVPEGIRVILKINKNTSNTSLNQDAP